MTTVKSNLVTIDRNFRPELPERVVGWDHPELINSLHRELDMTRIICFATRDPIDRTSYDERSYDQRPIPELMSGYDLYRIIVKREMLRYCLNLQIADSILKRDRLDGWSGKKVFLFQSVVFDKDRTNYLVPFIQCIRGQKARIYWLWLAYQINTEDAVCLYPH